MQRLLAYIQALTYTCQQEQSQPTGLQIGLHVLYAHAQLEGNLLKPRTMKTLSGSTMTPKDFLQNT